MTWTADSFCGRLGMSLPVVQAPIGRAATPELVAAVSEAGGLGVLALSWTSVEGAARRVQLTQALTSRPFGANFVLAWPQEDRVRACLDAGVRVVSTSWGDPSAYTPLVHQAGAVHVHMVGAVDDARHAADAGVDAVVAQGAEAGGHVLGATGTLALVPAVVDAVTPVPVLAAGGITDARGVAAVLALGAAAAWVGTLFLLADEADVHSEYRRLLLAAGTTDTVYGSVFDGGWRGAPHRTLVNSTLATWRRAGAPPSGHRPGEREVVAHLASGEPVLRYSSDLPTRTTVGEVEAMALYAGQGVGLVRATASAAQLASGLAARAGTDDR